MERLYRNMSDQQKQAISNSLKGRSFSPTHCANLSAALRRYWAGLSYAPSGTTETNSQTRMRDEEQSSL